jgi:peptidoglycan/LPS O-acetylase OafA/YrhL
LSSVKTNRIAGLDGLRALSVLFVLALHCRLPYAKGGGYGVDVFFVLSGFLITGILAREYERAGGIRLPTFYFRRLLRLTPALFIMVIFFTALRAVLFPNQWPGFIWRETLPSLLYISDFTKIFTRFPHVFGHMWSLAIEEQFYLMWPLVLLIALPHGARFTLWLALGIATASALWRAALVAHGMPLQYWPSQGFETHLDGLLIGAALAMAPTSARVAIARLWTPAIVVFLWSVFTFDKSMHANYYGIAVLIEICTAVVIAKIVTDQKHVLTRSLDWWPLAQLGLISYAFYLWHGPILNVIKDLFGIEGWTQAALTLPLTILMAGLSWVLVERPARRWRDAALLIRKRQGVAELPYSN